MGVWGHQPDRRCVLEIVILTGMSGAGKTEALKCFEDLGYHAIDNLPASLLVNVSELGDAPGKVIERVAVVMDVRGGRSFEDLFEALEVLTSRQIPYTILFLDASDEVLVRRFSQTRRIHPLESEGLRVADTIIEERRLLERLLERADVVVDTSRINIYELRDKLCEIAGNSGGTTVSIALISFGYKFGLPMDADTVADVRFLPNPFWVEELRDLDGTDARVAQYVTEREEACGFLDRFYELVLFLLPLYRRERKTHLTIGVGCTGGRHRSVAITEALAGRLRESGRRATVTHRDRDRN